MQSDPEIVVVDDDDVIREIVVRLTLETVPLAHISSMPNGLEALAQIKIHGADLLITNFRMPGMDGPALVRELRGPGIRRTGHHGLEQPRSPAARRSGRHQPVRAKNGCPRRTAERNSVIA